MRKRQKLSVHFVRLLLLALACSTVFFCALHMANGLLLDHYFETSDFQQQRAEARISDLQSYADKQQVAATDAGTLLAWSSRQSLALMEIYRNDKLLFNSTYSSYQELSDLDIDAIYYEWYSYYVVNFADGPAEVMLYTDDTSLVRLWGTGFELLLTVALFLLIVLRSIRRIVRYIGVLSGEVQMLEGGDLEHPITVRGGDELGTLAQGLDSMRQAFAEQRVKEAAFFAANQSLITAMSHDLRTPLTKLMLYTEILRSGKYRDEEELQRYLLRIDEKAGQIKELSDNISAYSLMPKDKPFFPADPPAADDKIL